MQTACAIMWTLVSERWMLAASATGLVRWRSVDVLAFQRVPAIVPEIAWMQSEFVEVDALPMLTPMAYATEKTPV